MNMQKRDTKQMVKEVLQDAGFEAYGYHNHNQVFTTATVAEAQAALRESGFATFKVVPHRSYSSKLITIVKFA